jgi:acyl carrier protein
MIRDDLVANVLNKIISPKGLSISGYDEKIFDSGLIDSFGIVELVVALEENFQVKITYEDMTIQNFSSINEISKLINRLQCNENAGND